MNIDELYQSISRFWGNISPLLYFHIIAIIVLVWLYGNNWHLLDRIEQLLSTERYKKWRKILKEFSLFSKIPYIVLIIFLMYLSLLNNVLGMFGGFGPLSLVYSEIEFWRESRPLNELVDIASYQNNTNIRVWEINSIEQKFLEEYKTQYPEKYASLVSWISKNYYSWLRYYQLSLLFLILIFIFFITQIRKKPGRIKRTIKIVAIILFTFTAAVFFRVKAEQNIEESRKAELLFVVEQINMDKTQATNKMSDGDSLLLECSIYTDLAYTKIYTFRHLWVSRFLEKRSMLIRKMPSISDADFKQKYDYLEIRCKQSP